MHIYNYIYNQADHMTASVWFLNTLATTFFIGIAFYLYRFVYRDAVENASGWYDIENEITHGLCDLAMGFALLPQLISPNYWFAALMLAAMWFLARTLTWGKQLPWNKTWWDAAHVGMNFFMAIMFWNPFGSWILWLAGIFWVWMSLYNAREFCRHLKNSNGLILGSDISHILMSVVMLVMTVCPHLLMPSHMLSGDTTPGMGPICR